ncbi:chromosome partitioning protein ParB [Legionella steelei]|uniref:Probable chromosome-partitioning protein ParB n=1 Tax=Legionella steelei TaxID=947033 RepID=A0A0W0ZRH2_9GAMM|nr:ParB/RepB/Spo0J family partition protein [Legionella steelei]KTD71787.1 chromosome partitioning protein ParB [Legionella steelei]
MKFPAFEPINLKNDIQSLEAIDLRLSKIYPDKNQARKFFSDISLEELASSIRQHGIIQPILVKEMDPNKNEYQIIAGERRWRAAKIAGLEKIPAIIRKYDNANGMAVSLIENIQREDLNPLEEAQAIKRLIDECCMTHGEVAETLGRSRTTVTNLLRLLTLTDEVKEMLKTGLLEMGHARALLSLSSAQQEDVAKIVINKSLSVRETEQLVQRSNMPKDRQEFFLSPQFEQRKKEWIVQLSKKLSSTVNMHFNYGGKGKVVISFDSLEEADWLMSHLKVEG